MNEQELIDAAAHQAGIAKPATEQTINAFRDAVTNAVFKDDVVHLIGFGSLSQGARAARTRAVTRRPARRCSLRRVEDRQVHGR